LNRAPGSGLRTPGVRLRASGSGPNQKPDAWSPEPLELLPEFGPFFRVQLRKGT